MHHIRTPINCTLELRYKVIVIVEPYKVIISCIITYFIDSVANKWRQLRPVSQVWKRDVRGT